MNFVICDDDKADAGRLRALLEKYCKESGIGLNIYEFNSGGELLSAINNDIDVIFLDINMDDMDGLTIAKRIREKMDEVPIILVTAFMSYALDGYKVRASRFLLEDDLDNTFTECMDDIMKEIRRKSKIIVLDCVEGEVRIRANDIIMIETSGHKNIICLKDQRYQIYEKLDILTDKLKEYGFLRVHNSYLVNMGHIRSINNYMLTLDDERRIPVPKARYKQVKQEYTLFVGKEL